MMSIIKKILIVVDSIDINDSSGSKANLGIIKSLYSLNYNLKVYHYTRKKIEIPSINCFTIPEKKWNMKYFLSRSQRLFTRITKVNINPFFEGLFGFSFTFFNDVDSIVKSLNKEKEFKPDLIITLSKGASFRPHYALLKIPKWHSIWMAYIHDPYPFHQYPHPYNWKEPGYEKKAAFFKNVSKKAQFSAFPSLLLKEWMSKYYSKFKKSGIIIPHQNIEVSLDKNARFSYFDKKNFNILHAGNLMKQRPPVGLIEGFKLFLKKNPSAKVNSKLLLLGNADYHKLILNSYEKEISELYVSKSSIAYNDVSFLQQNTTINVILESKSSISPFLPGKFPHCVIANKPILLLGPSHSECRRLLGYDYPYFSEVDDVSNIAQIIEELYIKWLSKPNELKLNRDDLVEYVSPQYLKQIITSLK